MAKQMNVILDSPVAAAYREVLTREGRSVQRDLETYIKAKISLCSTPTKESPNDNHVPVNGVGEREVLG